MTTHTMISLYIIDLNTTIKHKAVGLISKNLNKSADIHHELTT